MNIKGEGGKESKPAASLAGELGESYSKDMGREEDLTSVLRRMRCVALTEMMC